MLYGCLNNNAINKTDVLGCSPGETINVKPMQIYIYYGHLSKSNPLKWKFNGRCALAAAIGCYPQSNNPDDTGDGQPPNALGPRNHQVPNAPLGHDDQMAVMGGAISVANATRRAANRGETAPSPEDEHGMPIALENITKNIQEAVDKLCVDDEVSELEVIVNVDSTGWNKQLQDGIDNFSPSWKGILKVGQPWKKKFKCGSNVKIP